MQVNACRRLWKCAADDWLKSTGLEKNKGPERKVEKKPDNPEYLSVKVLEDLPTFTGMDAKNYTLKNGDIESIPIYNARMLSDAGKVKLVKEVKVWLTKELTMR